MVAEEGQPVGAADPRRPVRAPAHDRQKEDRRQHAQSTIQHPRVLVIVQVQRRSPHPPSRRVRRADRATEAMRSGRFIDVPRVHPSVADVVHVRLLKLNHLGIIRAVGAGAASAGQYAEHYVGRVEAARRDAPHVRR